MTPQSSRPVAETSASPATSPAAPGSRRLLVPVLSPGREAGLRAIAVAWTASGAWFWLWWFAPARGDWPIERTLATVCLAWVFVMAAYFLFFACRMTRPNPALTLPRLRVAMVVTKAPSEPWPLVRSSLQAMLDQRMPYAYDTWLADERPTDEVRAWCAEHGVQVSTRFGVQEYHRAEWPRRTRCKEGNLAYFYDTVGYERYDVVAQLDCDHVPAPDYLRAVVAPFRDPKVGYVATPSICDANADAGWTVRGRLFREAGLHGPAQAGANGGWAPLCIGSHYGVRTSALREVGGIGPELAEDYSTTLILNSAGWQGAFAIDAEAHGLGPETVPDMLTQEIQWSRSLGAITSSVLPGRLRSLPPRALLRLLFALVFYPIQSAVCLIGVCLPSVGLLAGTSWGHASLTDFYVRLWLCSILLLVAVVILRRSQTLRPVDAKIFSIDVLLFQLTRWPWTAWGFFAGLLAGSQNAARPVKVTPKTDRRPGDARPPLPLGLLSPLMALAAGPTVVLAVAHPRTGTTGLYLIVLAQALLYWSVTAAVVYTHRHPRRTAMSLNSGTPSAVSHEDRIGLSQFFAEPESFRTVRRGWDPEQVRSALDALRTERDALREQVAGKAGAPGDAADPSSDSHPTAASVTRDLYAEVGEEIAEILRAAGRAATAKRTDAEQEAEQCTSAAQERAAEIVRAAEGESLALLDDAQAHLEAARLEADRIRTEAREQAARTVADIAVELDRMHAASTQVQALVERARDRLTPGGDQLEIGEAGSDVVAPA